MSDIHEYAMINTHIAISIGFVVSKPTILIEIRSQYHNICIMKNDKSDILKYHMTVECSLES